MSVSYKKLWKLLIDRDMKKKDLCVAAGISHAENELIDILRTNIAGIKDSYKRAIAMTALIRACTKKRPRGIFTYTGNRYNDGRKDLQKSLEQQFLEAVEAVNAAVFDNGMSCLSKHGDAMELRADKSDNFLDYSDMNMRYLRISGVLQRKGRGLIISPAKHVLAEALAKSTANDKPLIEEYRILCNGAPLPTDNEDGKEEFWQQTVFNENQWVLAQIFSCPCTIYAQKAFVGGKSETPSVLSGINRIQRWSQSKPPYLAFLYFFASIYSIQSRGQGCHQE